MLFGLTLLPIIENNVDTRLARKCLTSITFGKMGNAKNGLLWHRIMTMPSPRVTSKYSSNGKIKTFKRSMFTQSLNGIGATGRLISAGTWQ